MNKNKSKCDKYEEWSSCDFSSDKKNVVSEEESNKKFKKMLVSLERKLKMGRKKEW